MYCLYNVFKGENMNYKYVLIKSKDETLGGIDSYGIDIRTLDDNKEIISIPCLFVEKNRAEDFVDMCNFGKIDPIHIQDILEDIL